MKFLIFFLTITLSLTTIIADNPLSITLEEGKNNFTINESFPSISIKELAIKHPEIKQASLTEYGTTYGFVNSMGGIGTPFIVETGRTYEIFVNETVIIYLKE